MPEEYPAVPRLLCKSAQRNFSGEKLPDGASERCCHKEEVKMSVIILASGNKNKLTEIRKMLEGTGCEVISMKEAGYETDIEETGTTFLENALIKAEAIARLSGTMTMADDSGLVIDALGGEPGIYSARYLGEDTPYTIKNAELLGRMAKVPEEERTARFVCAMALVFPDGRHLTAEETFEGKIAWESVGENGFGYDPIFYVPEKQCTSAELEPEEKNRISHRGKALRHMRELLTRALTDSEAEVKSDSGKDKTRS